MKHEIEQLEYNDVLVQLNSCFEQYGVREVMKDFRSAYPEMFEEMTTQLARLTPAAKAALLRPPNVGTM